jgi:hypothetical protein
MQRRGQRAEVGLRGEPGEAVHGGVEDVDARLDGGQHRGRGDAAGVVGVEVDRQAGLLLQRRNQDARGGRLEHAGHVLETDQVRADGFQLGGSRSYFGRCGSSMSPV